jgi:hypothetical protein
VHVDVGDVAAQIHRRTLTDRLLDPQPQRQQRVGVLAAADRIELIHRPLQHLHREVNQRARAQARQRLLEVRQMRQHVACLAVLGEQHLQRQMRQAQRLAAAARFRRRGRPHHARHVEHHVPLPADALDLQRTAQQTVDPAQRMEAAFRARGRWPRGPMERAVGMDLYRAMLLFEGLPRGRRYSGWSDGQSLASAGAPIVKK